jgi:hypothetical protein
MKTMIIVKNMIFNAVKTSGGFQINFIFIAASIIIVMKKIGIMSHGKNRNSESWELEEIFPVSVIQPPPISFNVLLFPFMAQQIVIIIYIKTDVYTFHHSHF